MTLAETIAAELASARAELEYARKGLADGGTAYDESEWEMMERLAVEHVASLERIAANAPQVQA